MLYNVIQSTLTQTMKPLQSFSYSLSPTNPSGSVPDMKCLGKSRIEIFDAERPRGNGRIRRAVFHPILSLDAFNPTKSLPSY